MELTHSLKRSASVDYNSCLICQTDKPGYILRKSSETGINSLRDAALSRRKMRDIQNYDVIDRIENVLKPNMVSKPVWHKTCYSTFTSKHKILKRRRSLEMLGKSTMTEASTSTSCEAPTVRTLRSNVESVDWKFCICCQQVQPKVHLVRAMTKELSRQIIDDAQYDHTMGIRVADENDLIAAEGKYHLGCLSAFRRRVARTNTDTQVTDLAMIWLSNELHYAAEKGQVLQLNTVWERYVELAKDSSTNSPRSYHSRRATFKEKLQSDIGDIFYFVQPLDRVVSERQTLLISMKFGQNAMLNTAASDELSNDELLTMPHYTSDEDIFLSLIHVALKLRGDVTQTKEHTGLSVNEDDAIECVPDSLYMFLRVMYGGQSCLEGECNDYTEDQVRRKVLSVAQDIVYGISGGKKLTPKHICLASTVHQATRSKCLVQLLHNAGHCLSYDQVLRMDTALAEHTLQTLDPITGAVIPPNIVAGNFVHYTADNIDILDETLDGKNTFHATHMCRLTITCLSYRRSFV